MHYAEHSPPPPLDRWVRCFWTLRTRGAGAPQPVVPDGRLEIVLHRAEPFARVLPDESAVGQEAVMVSGQLTRPILLRASGAADIIGIRFRTAAARDLLALPLSELTNQVVDLRLVSASLARALEAAGHAPDPLRELSVVLLDRLRERAHPATADAVTRLTRGESLARIARESRISTRTIERRVLGDTGLPPKTLQRVARFRTYYGLLQRGGGSGARAALLAGYYDQSHANRDFRRFAGGSPAEHFGDDPELARAIMSHPS